MIDNSDFNDSIDNKKIYCYINGIEIGKFDISVDKFIYKLCINKNYNNINSEENIEFLSNYLYKSDYNKKIGDIPGFGYISYFGSKNPPLSILLVLFYKKFRNLIYRGVKNIDRKTDVKRSGSIQIK